MHNDSFVICARLRSSSFPQQLTLTPMSLIESGIDHFIVPALALLPLSFHPKRHIAMHLSLNLIHRHTSLSQPHSSSSTEPRSCEQVFEAAGEGSQSRFLGSYFKHLGLDWMKSHFLVVPLKSISEFLKRALDEYDDDACFWKIAEHSKKTMLYYYRIGPGGLELKRLFASLFVRERGSRYLFLSRSPFVAVLSVIASLL